MACCPLFAAVSFEREQLLFAAAGLLLFAAVCAALLRRARAFRAAGAGRVAALSLVAVPLGALASIGPALGAPRGFPVAAADPWILASLFALGWFPIRRARCWWWGGLAVGLAAGAAAIPLLPASPGLAGVENLNRGAEVEVAWSASGARVRVVDPLDPPLLYENGEPRDLERERIARLRPASRRRCPDADGERRAAWNAFLSANLDAAIARGRLALTICGRDAFARSLVGEALLRRGVAELRCGRLAEARRDIEQASRLLGSKAALGRARRAESLLASGLVSGSSSAELSTSLAVLDRLHGSIGRLHALQPVLRPGVRGFGSRGEGVREQGDRRFDPGNRSDPPADQGSTPGRTRVGRGAAAERGGVGVRCARLKELEQRWLGSDSG